MRDYLFPPPPVSAVAIDGDGRLFPVRRVFCVGRNYEAHAKEMGVKVDREAPFYFTKGRDAIVASGATVAYPPGTSNYHFEMELVVAIGGDAWKTSEDTARSAIFGYACGLDMTRRDLQLAARAQQRPWDLGKDFEDSAVISPIAPAARIGHPFSGRLELAVNGATKQSSDLSFLIWPPLTLVAHLSNFYHLQAGDLIYTGTPEGVGPVQPGDVLMGRIEGVGEIHLTIGTPDA
jgi:fumarylpyruvate hydrolase